ncbi:MAG: 4-(cytidine 5'-diphospho)-2-C-methyl-D-erythritol kinase [Gammaproteobacteria bacterium]|nr:MAG: 4-(cytidine 5'-diphospho)-2-C-methyl-D-erythritol kinase [Gammaproteobacteria bacterium]
MMPTDGGGPWPAPAKLNLFLHITGRRPDGYHELQTVFQFLDYGDSLWFEAHAGGAITLQGGLPGLPAERDLIVRAARSLATRTGCTKGVRIRIDKRLPVGAGLGGGSSNAATTLVALNSLWGLALGSDELAALGLELGADVPVFVRGSAAWAEGVGERLTPIEVLEEPWYLVLHPAVSISTAEIFSDPGLTRNAPRITIRDFLSGAGGNHLEAVVARRYPEVAKALEWLSGYQPARMTGSGACVFARFPDRQAAEAVMQQVPAPWTGFVARGCNRSPLLDRLGESRGQDLNGA